MSGGPVIGNDVVDLRDPDARPEALHPRFDPRAFHAAERAFVGTGPGANRRRWSLWAAKEAAHKALRQERPEWGFAPRHYRVSLGPDGTGVVRRGDARIAVRVEVAGDRVHAVAFRGDPARVCVQTATCAELGEPDPGRAVRALLRRGLAGAGRVELARRERVPCLRLDGRRVPVSFSHHGRWVAVARAAGPPACVEERA
jgi:hypothetical protein